MERGAARDETQAEANVHAIVVRRHGRLVDERYFCGEDERYGEPLGLVSYDASTKHDLRSITKSVVSLLVGIAIDRGWVPHVDVPVLSAFPEYGDLHASAASALTLRHLLTMSAGLAWNEALPYSDPRNSERRMNDAPDRSRFVLEQPAVHPPGGLFCYNGGLTILLAEFVERAAGRPLDVFASEALFEPLGIVDVEWLRYPDGTPNATSGLRMRASDVAKFGQLMLDGGAWAGRQIVSSAWLRESTADHVRATGPVSYAYHWWLGRMLLGGKEIDWIGALGYGGQRLYVVPKMHLVVVVFAGLYANPDLASTMGETILREHVLAAVAG